MFDGNALPDFARGKSLISAELHAKITATCGEGLWNATGTNSTCDLLMKGEVDAAISKLNIYNVLEKCYRGGPPLGEPRPERFLGRAWPMRSPLLPGPVLTWPQLRLEAAGPAADPPPAGSGAGGGAGGGAGAGAGVDADAPPPLVVPCMDSRLASAFLNDAAVRAALHARPVALTGRWLICTGGINYTHDAGSMIPVHRQLTSEAGLRALIYTGDADSEFPLGSFWPDHDGRSY